jgi:hypothetical protein
MRAQVTTRRDGTVLLRMDQEAARAAFASVIFAARYHEGMRGLEEIAKKALESEQISGTRRNATCR